MLSTILLERERSENQIVEPIFKMHAEPFTLLSFYDRAWALFVWN